MSSIARFGSLAFMVVGGCTPPVVYGPDPLPSLQINGDAIRVPRGTNAFEALRRSGHYSAVGDMYAARATPLFLLDDVELLDGMELLKSLSVCDLESIQVLRSLHAVPRYGEKARSGAVVARSRRAAHVSGC